MSHPRLRPITPRKSVRETVSETLRSAILSGDLKEGELYSGPALAKMLGVSATPVREAMMDLDREGLVTTEKNKGFRITGMTDQDLEEITSIRLMVEPQATYLAAQNRQGIDYEVLRELAHDIIDAARSENIPRYLIADRDFHEALIWSCGNRQLVELVSRLRLRTRQYGLNALVRQKKLALNASEHLVMVELMESGDAEGLRDLVSTHIQHARGVWNTTSSTGGG